MPGEGKLGHYRLIELIGRGGMGQVWLAEDTRLEREVALKLLPAELATDADYRRRFEREARLAARLRGPHVVPIHAFGELDGRLYIDMELIDGSDLGKTLREDGSLAPGRAVDLVAQVAEALDIAHRAGLVHRDVKPSNVLTLPNGFAYLIDFGIARGVGQATITTTGVAVGTWAYMAPERYSGTEDLRSDVYSLACMLFETLTGAKPFAHADPVQQMAAHITADPPRASDHNPQLPTTLDAVIRRGMAKDPAHRFPTAGALAAAARTAWESRPATTGHPERRAAPTAKWDGGEHFPGHGATPVPPYPTPAPGPSAYGGTSGGATPPPGSTPRGFATSPGTEHPGDRTPGSGRLPGAQAYGGMSSGATPPPGSTPRGFAPSSGMERPGDRTPGSGRLPGVTPHVDGRAASTPGSDALAYGGMPGGATPPPAASQLPPGSRRGGVIGGVARQSDPVDAASGSGAMAYGGITPVSGASTYGGMGSGGVGYVSPYGGRAYSGAGGVGPDRPRASVGRVFWWIALGMLILLFGMFTAAGLDVLITDPAHDTSSLVGSVVAELIFALPLVWFVWLAVREVRRFRAGRGGR